MEEINLAVEKREDRSTKKALSALRAAAKIPGIIYGAGKPPVRVALSEREILDIRRKGGVNAILRLQLGSAAETVIVKELQWHPVTDRPIHVDFQRISLTEKIEAKVPLHILGEAPGVKVSGGILQHELRELTVRGLPAEIPSHVDVDVSRLEINQHILVKELAVGPGLEVLDIPEHMVVHVALVREQVAAAPEAVAAEGAAPAEPEISATKGKKDEEGKPLPKEAKAAPAAEKGKEKAAGAKEGKGG